MIGSLSFKPHCMGNALKVTFGYLACAGFDCSFKRTVWNKGVDQRAIQRLGGSAQRVKLDRSRSLRLLDRFDRLGPDPNSPAELRTGHAKRIT